MPVRPAALQEALGWASEFLEAAANEGAVVIQENLDQEGSGVHYAGLPRRSSAPGEYPAPQSRELQNSIDARPFDAFRYGVGAYDAPEHAIYLEFYPPAQGGRVWLSRTMETPITHARMLAAGRAAVGGR